jgi:hypothetical protein
MAASGSRKIYSGTCELRSQVVYISRQHESDCKEETDEYGSNLGFSVGRGPDYSIFSDNLDTINVRACTFLR